LTHFIILEINKLVFKIKFSCSRKGTNEDGSSGREMFELNEFIENAYMINLPLVG